MAEEENGKSKHRRKRDNEEINEGEKKKVKEKKKKRKMEKNQEEEEKKEVKFSTVSIAIAGSIIDNAQSLDLATRLAGQIARAATIFRIDEVVVFDDKEASVNESSVTTTEFSESDERGAPFLIRILRYLETPQYLRRNLFPMHKNFRFVGLLPPLDAPHHVRKHEWSYFREAFAGKMNQYLPYLSKRPGVDQGYLGVLSVTLEGMHSNPKGTLVNVGLNKEVLVDQVLNPGVRVTVEMGANRNPHADLMKKVVLQSKPREEMGIYWGYKVRYASSIGSVFTESPYQGGYDYTVGTSEHGRVTNSSELDMPKFRHLLIAFGGLGGLEESIEQDNTLKGKNVNEVFSDYLNTCPNQGSRTIRSEYFQEPIARAVLRFK